MMKDNDTNPSDTGESDPEIAAEDFGESLPPPPPVRRDAGIGGGGGGGRKKKRAWMILGAVAAAALVLGLSLGLALPNGDGSSGGAVSGKDAAAQSGGRDPDLDLNAPPDGGVPGDAPAPDGTTGESRLAEVQAWLLEQGISTEEALQDEETPQHLAALWLADEDGASLELPVDQDYEVMVDNYAYDFVTRYALAVLFFGTSQQGGGWIGGANFLFQDHVCLWQGESFISTIGVTCDVATSTVISLVLEFNNLAGSIPSEITKIWSLKVLDLEGNRLSGSLPTELADMPVLRSLLLGRNELTGGIPPGLGKNGVFNNLVLSNNQMSGGVPDSLALSKSWIAIGLDTNQFSGDINTFLTNDMVNLTLVFLDDNLFTGTVDDNFLTQQNKLRTLDFSDNMIDGIIPAHWFTLENLEIIDVHGNSLSGALPEFPANYVLGFLAVHQNELSGEIPESIANLLDLYHLDLAENSFTGTMPAAIGQLEFLTYLFLAANDFTAGPIPDYSALINLRELNLKSTSRSETIPDFIGNMTDLVLLDLDDNELEGPIPTWIGNLWNLYGLLLNRNSLSGPVPTELGTLESLSLLFIDRNNLEGNLDAVCALTQFANATQQGEEALGGFLYADCVSEVACDCCTLCCDDNDPDGCHDNDFVAGSDYAWERAYGRPDLVFGNDTVLPGYSY